MSVFHVISQQRVPTDIGRICVSENGWTDGELALQWIMKDFDPQTRAKAAGETRVLILDGHSSHYTADLLEYCLANNIEVLGYPPHCTHALQGLDVVCFAKMKAIWKEEINTFETLHKKGVDKEDFCGVFGHAFLRAFTTENIESAFSATGIYPFNPDVIRPEQMKPAEATSIRSAFPLPQPSPVRAVISACRNHEFTHQECHPDSPVAAGSSNFPGSLSDTSGPIDPSLQTSPKRPLDPASNPNFATPSKRMRFLAAGLASTSSGSMLITRSRVTHLDMAKFITPPITEQVPPQLKAPDWTLLQHTDPLSSLTRAQLEAHVTALEESLERSKKVTLAQQVIIEGANAQLVVQNLTMDKINQTLHEKEKTKRSDRAILFPGGKGRHLTDPELIQKKRELEEEKKREEAEKERRKTVKDDKKAEKERLEVQWQQMLQEHECAVVEWEETCRRLRAEGERVKNLPKRPKRPLKPKLKETEENPREDGDDEDEDAASDRDDQTVRT